MAQNNITYVDKVTSNPQPSIPAVNKVTGDDMTEIKTVVNGNATDTTTHKNNTSNPHSVDATDVGLGNCDNTSDVNKPVSTAAQTALDLKGNQTEVDLNTAKVGITPTQANDITDNNAKVSDINHVTIELPNVDNTSDANKPVSTATQTALDGKRPNIGFETQTADFSPTNKGDNKYVNVDKATDVTVTFNTGAFSKDGDVVFFQQISAGRILFSNGTASITAAPSLSLVSGGIGSITAVVRKSASVYILTGTTE